MLERKSYVVIVPLLMAALVWVFGTVAAPVDNKTVLYMSFDKEPNDAVEDESGNGNDGVIMGRGIKWTKDGRFGGALEFNGTSRIEVPHSETLNPAKSLSLEIWFKTDMPQKGKFLMYKVHNGGGRNYEWGIYLTGQSTQVSMYVVNPNDDVNTAGKNGDYNDDEWHFLAGTYDGKTIQCFVDGNLVTTQWQADIRTSDGPVIIGAWATGYFTGVLDEVRICKVALTEEQLKSDYENGYNILAVDSHNKLTSAWGRIKTQ